MRAQTPKISQPAMAVPGYCYTVNTFTVRHLVQDKVGENFEDLAIAGTTWLVLGSSMLFIKLLLKSRTVIVFIGWGIISVFVVMIVRLFQMWGQAQPYLQESTSETDWGFGQVVALILLIGPILTFIQTITGQCLLSYLLPITFSTNKNS
jgi:amino acid transporter